MKIVLFFIPSHGSLVPHHSAYLNKILCALDFYMKLYNHKLRYLVFVTVLLETIFPLTPTETFSHVIKFMKYWKVYVYFLD
jgi:hypothetical protein